MKDKLSTHYDLFDAKERINLTIAALARDDEDELMRLRVSCSRKHYTMLDADYCFGMDRVRYACMAYADLCKSAETNAMVCNLLITLSDELRSLYDVIFDLVTEDLGEKYKPSESVLSKKQEALAEYQFIIDDVSGCFRKRVSELKTLHETFKDFCQKAGIDHEFAYKWVAKADVFEVSDHINFDDFEVDVEFGERMERSFLELWNG